MCTWEMGINREKIAACAKHFVGDGGTVKGINENDTIASWHELFSIHMPAYYHSVFKGVSTIMVSYSSLNGLKMHANRRLINDFLKGVLRFRVLYYSPVPPPTVYVLDILFN